MYRLKYIWRGVPMFLIRIILVIALLLCSFNQASYSADDVFLTVQVKQGQLRSTPSFLGSITATCAYGSKVKLIEDKGAWKKVTIRKNTGWMHESALTTKTIILEAGKSDVKTGATKGELALAGKGFNSKVEAEFKSKNNAVNYTWVDRMETYTVKSSQMQAFLKQGQVVVPEETMP
jgi:hypothetical protein